MWLKKALLDVGPEWFPNPKVSGIQEGKLMKISPHIAIAFAAQAARWGAGGVPPSGWKGTDGVAISSVDQLEARDDQILVEAIEGIGDGAASTALELGVLVVEIDLDVLVE
jgi:hypothetical protein